MEHKAGFGDEVLERFWTWERNRKSQSTLK